MGWENLLWSVDKKQDLLGSIDRMTDIVFSRILFHLNKKSIYILNIYNASMNNELVLGVIGNVIRILRFLHN